MKQSIEATTATQARKIAPWADKIVKVEGGYLAFETINEYKTWKNQK